MKTKQSILEGIGDSTVDFKISGDMLKLFSDLTDDSSSLHTNGDFGRKSTYRDNVVHGMLPVTFISTLPLCHIDGFISSFLGISAAFFGPIFVNDKLSVSVKISEINEEEKQVTAEYTIKKSGSEKVLTAGNFILQFSPLKNENKKISHKGCYHMVNDPLGERDLKFDEISKSKEDSFEFLISEGHRNAFCEILKRGLLNNGINLQKWHRDCNITNLLSSCLFSTFAGMCIPGRHATFMNFNVVFSRPIQYDKKYILKGKVSFKSQSASSIIEDITICETENKKGVYAMGKINAKVNEPPIKMPSLDFLKKSESDLQLKDKVVLITGASRGIGEVTAKMFSLYGARVAINYFRGKGDAEKIVDEIKKDKGDAIAVQADVSDREQVKKMVAAVCKKYGTIHILVNNAVRDFYTAPFAELTWNDFQRDIDVIIKGAFNCCQEVLPLMFKNKAGKIINISTLVADSPVPGQSKYIVAKSGLVGLSRSLAVEFASRNIQVNIVVPSIVETDLTKHIPKIFMERIKRETPMQRNTTPIDVAKAVVFLSSSLASFTTGQKIMVTGGNPPFL